MDKETVLTTLCCIESERKYLMLHRGKKENDVDRDRWDTMEEESFLQ